MFKGHGIEELYEFFGVKEPDWGIFEKPNLGVDPIKKFLIPHNIPTLRKFLSALIEFVDVCPDAYVEDRILWKDIIAKNDDEFLAMFIYNFYGLWT
jgi:hypothetical protein